MAICVRNASVQEIQADLPLRTIPSDCSCCLRKTVGSWSLSFRLVWISLLVWNSHGERHTSMLRNTHGALPRKVWLHLWWWPNPHPRAGLLADHMIMDSGHSTLSPFCQVPRSFIHWKWCVYLCVHIKYMHYIHNIYVTFLKTNTLYFI